ncbi:MAG: TIGR03564 family F420-dependent LLM class oxidoreductase [Dehalococcoidia bacterium]
MRIGIGLGISGGPATFDQLITETEQAEQSGFSSVWIANIFSYDALTVLAFAARATQRIEVGSFVIPTYPRHPVALAQQALTVQAVTGGRLALGIGLSHKIVIEDMFGLDYSKPIPHTREYLTVLNSLLAGERTVFQGEHYRVAAQLTIPGATKPPVLVAALGPDMLRLCGRLADGTATWMGGITYLRDVAVPTITAAADRAGRSAPRIVAGLPICVTNDVTAARADAERNFATYGRLPSYRATLDRGGAAGPGDVAILGNESEVETQVQALATAGVTDFNGVIFSATGGSTERTYELLAHLASQQLAAV